MQVIAQTETIQLKYFLNRKYDEYCQYCPAKSSISEKERRLVYLMEFYYIHLHQYLCADILQIRKFLHWFEDGQLIPLVSPSMLKTPDKTHAAAVSLRYVPDVVCVHRCESSALSFLQTFDSALWEKWGSYELMAQYTGKPKE